MYTIAIVGGGPLANIPTLKSYVSEIDIWIGADEGASYIVNEDLPLHTAIGDFDSVTEDELQQLSVKAGDIKVFPKEKDETDLELAIRHAIKLRPSIILFFGVTGGRIDHTLINIQLLYSLIKKGVRTKIIDTLNVIELYEPGDYKVNHSSTYPYISFIPMSETVKGISLRGFYYPLEDKTVQWGETLCLSNKLLLENGNFSFDDGILILIKSRDQMTQPIY